MEADSRHLRLSTSARNSCWNGHQLHCWAWHPTHPPRAALCFIHGVTEHMRRYDALCLQLAESGILVFGQDLVGHGKSEGERVVIDSIATYVKDVICHVEDMKREHPSLPCLLMGHSMGGLIASHVAVQRQELFTALILSAPALTTKPGALTSIGKTVVKGVAYLLPQTPLIPWDTSTVSSMPEEVVKFREDKDVYHGLICFGWVRAMLEAMETIQGSIHEVAIPLLILHGRSDPTVPLDASRFAFRSVCSRDKTLEMFDGKHEVLHDREQERAKTIITDWILAHLPQTNAMPT